MKFAVSNIAWAYPERLEAYALLQDHGFTGLEIAPGMLFAEEADPLVPSKESAQARIAEFERFGLALVSMQSLLYGVEGASLFGDSAGVERLVRGLTRAIEFAGRLGIANLVFGSPKQRIVPPQWDEGAVMTRMREVFLPLADLAAAHRTVLALETNATAYGTNFMTTFPETLEIVRAVDHPAVTLNFDIGALYMTDTFDKVGAFADQARQHLSHVHISCADLAPAPPSEADARLVLDAVAAIRYDRSISIEMKAVSGDGLATLTASLVKLRTAAVAGNYV
jgi:sugar phosphate isomerase/epimerase